MRIGELAELTGVSAKTIRYYESTGLMLAPPRDASGYRRYEEADSSRLHFILGAKQLGMTLDEIDDVLQASRSHEVSCPHLVALLELKRERIAESIRQAQLLHDVLDRTIRAAKVHVVSASSPDDCCPVIDRGLHERARQATGDA